MVLLRVSVTLFLLNMGYHSVHTFFHGLHKTHPEPIHVHAPPQFYPVHVYKYRKVKVPQRVPVVIKPIIKTVKVPVKHPYPVKVPYPVRIPYPVPVYHREKVPIFVKQLVPYKVIEKQPVLIKVKEYVHNSYDKKPVYETIKSGTSYGNHENSYDGGHETNAVSYGGHESEDYDSGKYSSDYGHDEQEYKTPASVYSSDDSSYSGQLEKDKFYQENGYSPSSMVNYSDEGNELQQSEENDAMGYAQESYAANTMEPKLVATYGSYQKIMLNTETEYKTGQLQTQPTNYVNKQEVQDHADTTDSYQSQQEYKSK